MSKEKIVKKNKPSIQKPENYIFIIIIGIIGIISILGLCVLWSQISTSFNEIINTIYFFTISMLVTILSAGEIKKLLNHHFRKNKFYIERIGIKENYFYIAIHNKTKEVALNCRVKGIFKDFFSYDLIWMDPAHPKSYDVPIEEYAYLFYYEENGTFRLPRGSIHPHFINPEFQKEGDIKKTYWTYERDDRRYEEFKEYELTVVISAENANSYQKTFTKLNDLITKLKAAEKNVILNKDFKDITLDMEIKID